MHSLPSSGRLLTFAVLLPAAVAGSNQLLFNLVGSYYGLRMLLYPWMAFTTAVLSWCAGRYLWPPWLRWLVFGWCLVLLDVLTIAACLGGGVERHFGYVLVSAQVSLLVLWSIAGSVLWQWRLPAVLIGTAMVVTFSGSFAEDWSGPAWNLMMVLSAAIMAILSIALRWQGFMLRKSESVLPLGERTDAVQSNQFGLKHMLIWATAVVPLLLVLRGINYFMFANLAHLESTFAAALTGASLAAVNLLAIWLVLGSGSLLLRLIAIAAVPPLVAACLMTYSGHIATKYGRWLNLPVLDSIYYEMKDYWITWLWLNTALLAALLLFLRAGGYRLIRKAV